MRYFLACLCFALLSVTAANSQVQPRPLSNKDVIEMVSIGLSDEVIIEKIRSVKLTNFDTSVEGLRALKAARVSDAVLKAMINPRGSSTAIREAKGQLDGKAIATRAVDSLGGLDRLQAIKSLSLDFVWTPTSPEGQSPVHLKTIIEFPDRIRVEAELPQGQSTSVVTPEVAFVSARGDLRDMTAEEKSDGLRELRRHLVYVGQHLNAPQFSFDDVGTEKVGGTDTEIVDVNGPGVSVRWFVELQTGHILREAYPKKGMTAATELMDWKTVDGLTLPYVRKYADGTVQYNSIQINPVLDSKIFDRPPSQKPSVSSAFRQEVNPAAIRAIDQVLQGARVIELPEGKRLVEQNRWVELDLPLFNSSETLSESWFDTDATGIRGVKRLVELTGAGDAGTGELLTEAGKRLRDLQEQYGRETDPLIQVKQRFLIAAYQDAATKAWRVISVTSKTDTSAEVNRLKDYYGTDRATLLGAKPSLKRYWFAWALIDDGKLNQARQELGACLDMLKRERAPDADKASSKSVALSLNVIEAILGLQK